MPHLTLEYTADLRDSTFDQRHLLKKLNLAIADLGEGIQLADIKSRAVCLEETLIGAGQTSQTFVHARLALLNTRPEAFKVRAAETVLAVLKNYFDNRAEQVELCSEVQDIAPACYRKTYLPAR